MSPDRYFRLVRYYNWLSNRTRGQYLPFVYQSLNQIAKKLQALSWRELFIKTFGKDPLLCTCCKRATMSLISCEYTHNLSALKNKHQLLAYQRCQLIQDNYALNPKFVKKWPFFSQTLKKVLLKFYAETQLSQAQTGMVLQIKILIFLNIKLKETVLS